MMHIYDVNNIRRSGRDVAVHEGEINNLEVEVFSFVINADVKRCAAVSMNDFCV